MTQHASTEPSPQSQRISKREAARAAALRENLRKRKMRQQQICPATPDTTDKE